MNDLQILRERAAPAVVVDAIEQIDRPRLLNPLARLSTAELAQLKAMAEPAGGWQRTRAGQRARSASGTPPSWPGRRDAG